MKKKLTVFAFLVVGALASLAEEKKGDGGQEVVLGEVLRYDKNRSVELRLPDGEKRQYKITSETIFKDKNGRVTAEFRPEQRSKVKVETKKSSGGWEIKTITPIVQDIGGPEWGPKPRTNQPPRRDLKPSDKD